MCQRASCRQPVGPSLRYVGMVKSRMMTCGNTGSSGLPCVVHPLNFLKASATGIPWETASMTLSSAATSLGIKDSVSSNRLCGMTTTPSFGSQKTISPCSSSVRSVSIYHKG